MTEQLPGDVIEAPPATVSDREDTAINSTSTSYVAGATVCGVAFTAPLTGRVMIHWSGYLDNNGANSTHLSIRVGQGATVGAGTAVLLPNSAFCIMNLGTEQRQYGTSYLLTGLTPGAAYNVQTMHVVSGGTGDVANRHVMVAPAT